MRLRLPRCISLPTAAEFPAPFQLIGLRGIPVTELVQMALVHGVGQRTPNCKDELAVIARLVEGLSHKFFQVLLKKNNGDQRPPRRKHSFC